MLANAERSPTLGKGLKCRIRFGFGKASEREEATLQFWSRVLLDLDPLETWWTRLLHKGHRWNQGRSTD